MPIQTTVQDIIDNLDHMQLYVPIEMKETLALASAMLVRCECPATTPSPADKIPSDFISAKGEVVDWNERSADSASSKSVWTLDMKRGRGEKAAWTSACGKSTYFTEHMHPEIMNFCPFCGKKLLQDPDE